MKLSESKWYLSAALLLLQLLSLKAQTESIHTFSLKGSSVKDSVITTSDRITINYSVGDVTTRSFTTSAGEFYTLQIKGHNKTSSPGKPELPVFSKLIVLPENSAVSIRISKVRSETVSPKRVGAKGMLYPRQVDATKNQDRQKLGFVIDRELYNQKGLIKSDTASIELIGKIRERQIAALHIFPARYNPYANELEVITSMTVEVIFTKSGSASSMPSVVSTPLAAMTDKGTLNYSPADFITGWKDKPAGMIILSDTSFRKFLKPLIEWKTQKGYRITTLYKGTGLAGNTFAELKDTITSIYNAGKAANNPPDYLLIIGDPNVIPKSDGTSQISDLYYGEFDGNGDYLPDIYIGRLPAADTSEVRNVVDKIIRYEKFMFADTNRFYRRSLVTAGNDAGYSTYMNGQVNYASNVYLNPANNINGHSFLYPQSATAEDTIKKLVNTGLSFINYSGHGDATGWLDPVIKVPDIEQFTNKNMYPLVISNACLTARYSIVNSFGNRMVVSKEKGAIAFIGCSNDSYWDEDYFWSVGVGPIISNPAYNDNGLGAYDRLFHTHNENASDWYTNLAQINYAGNLAVSASTSTKKKYYWETYTLLGDPSIIPYIGDPKPFTVQLPDTLPNGLTSLSLTIEPFAYIAVSHWNTLYDAAYSSPSGSVVLDLPGLVNDSCLVVITGQNRKPLFKKILFRNIEKEFINLTSAEINDAASNNNRKADYGETFFLKTKISNLGLSSASGLYAQITTESDWITITDGYEYIGDLPAVSEITLIDKFSMKVDALIPDMGYITLNLKLKDTRSEKNYRIDIPLHAPELSTASCIIDDSETGNNDHIADPGETVELLFTVVNSGSSATSGSLVISSSGTGITINQPSVPTGILNAGESKVIPVSVTLSPLLTKGSTFAVITDLNCDPYFVNKSFSVAVGKIRESFEYQTFTVFPWIISSSSPWIITQTASFEGQFAARSAAIPHNSESVLSIRVNVPVTDTLKFMYRVSSELNYDFLSFKLNGTQVLKSSGETAWLEKKVALREGINLLEWIYRKDESVSSYSDCAMIDFITFPTTGFNTVDLKTGKIVTPQPGKDYAQEYITAQVINFGTQKIESFNLAYIINSEPPVAERFSKAINPGDTAVVGFSAPANLEGTGAYLVKVYGFNNNDGYLLNDTSKVTIYNTFVEPLESPENKLEIWPNPFSDSFTLTIDTFISDDVSVILYDNSGRELLERRYSVFPGSNQLTIAAGHLPPGFYTLQVMGKSVHKAARIIKR